MVAAPHRSEMLVEAEMRLPMAHVRLARFLLAGPMDNVMHGTDGYRIDLCITPRPAGTRACYVERWGPHRFERLGDIFLLPPGQTLVTRGDGGRQTSIFCELRPEAVSAALERELEWSDRQLEASLDIVSPAIHGLMLRLAEEVQRPGFASELLAELVVGQLAIELGRFCAGIEDRPVTGGLAPWRLRLIDERLREEASPPTLSELAGLCGLSIRQLTRGFRASRGRSIADHVAQGRIEAAKRRLAGEESIKAVAFGLGFASASSFAYAFRRATGTTPRQFRQRVRRAVG